MRHNNTALLLALALLCLLIQPATPLLSLLGRNNNKKETKKEKEQQDSNKATGTATTAAAAVPVVPAADDLLLDAEGKPPADWTRSQQQHQRPGRRRLETHVDGEEVLNLLQHEPVKLSLEEAQDWQHVKRRLGEAREKSGFFHRVADAFVPPNSALRRKEREAGDKEGEDAAEGLAANTNGSGGGETEKEYQLFDKIHRLKRREQAQQQMGV
jgi:hypothetical protein